VVTDRVAQLLEESQACLAPLDEARGLPATAFTDPEWFEAEQGEIFAKSWIAVARSEDLSAPGSFRTATIAREPVVVTRARDGVLHAMSNTCPHRGTLICNGSGTAPSLRCPNHAWTFGHDGQLRAAPHMAESFDVGSVCLPRFAVAEWNGFVMVNLDSTASSPAEQLAGLDEVIAGQPLTDLVRIGELHYPTPWNWKISVENFVESYHHRPVHPETLDSIYPGAQSFSRFVGDEPWGGVDHVTVIPEFDPFFAVAAFPTLLFAVLRGVGVTWFDLVPLGPGECDLRIEILVEPELAEEASYLVETTAAINEEDIAINEATWAGLQSAAYEPGPVSPLEGACWQFRRWLVGALEDGRSTRSGDVG
jgi:phenylpropionate dioxygenase-like ring-hydroxylating dioxygenase large terminal subunit